MMDIYADSEGDVDDSGNDEAEPEKVLGPSLQPTPSSENTRCRRRRRP